MSIGVEASIIRIIIKKNLNYKHDKWHFVLLRMNVTIPYIEAAQSNEMIWYVKAVWINYAQQTTHKIFTLCGRFSFLLSSNLKKNQCYMYSANFYFLVLVSTESLVLVVG